MVWTGRRTLAKTGRPPSGQGSWSVQWEEQWQWMGCNGELANGDRHTLDDRKEEEAAMGEEEQGKVKK